MANSTFINNQISKAIKEAGLTPVSYLNQVDSYGYFKHVHTCQELEFGTTKIYGEFGITVYEDTFEWELVQYDEETDEPTFEVLELRSFTQDAINEFKSNLSDYVNHVNKQVA
jgi:hypothetical protein